MSSLLMNVNKITNPTCTLVIPTNLIIVLFVDATCPKGREEIAQGHNSCCCTSNFRLDYFVINEKGFQNLIFFVQLTCLHYSETLHMKSTGRYSACSTIRVPHSISFHSMCFLLSLTVSPSGQGLCITCKNMYRIYSRNARTFLLEKSMGS